MERTLQVSYALTLDAVQPRVSGCTKCLLSETRTNAVFGEGDQYARVMLVGEAPGGRGPHRKAVRRSGRTEAR